MGPFSEGLITLQQTLWPELQRAGWVGDAPVWQPNPITAALAELGRNGVPVYVIYRKGAAPVVLSEVLGVDEVRSALARL